MSVSGKAMGFGIGISRPESIKLKKGESVIMSYWRWWPPGFIQKMITIEQNGEVTIKLL